MLRIAMDVGGTFTDAVAARDDGELLVMKLKSTPDTLEKYASARNFRFRFWRVSLKSYSTSRLAEIEAGSIWRS